MESSLFKSIFKNIKNMLILKKINIWRINVDLLTVKFIITEP